MTEQALNQIFEGFARSKVLVIGDVMIDAYLWGDVDRISPEAPVPVLAVSKKEQRLGGAANVAKNLIALGAEVTVVSIVGDDDNYQSLHDLFEKNGLSTEGLVRSAERRTSVKTRVISDDQHVVRVDEEDLFDLSESEESSLLNRMAELITAQDVVIFEDYNKGVLTRNVIEKCIEIATAHNIPTCVDPKKKNFFNYKGVALFKPNLKELAEGLKLDLDKNNIPSLTRAIELLQERLGPHCTLLTLSENGVLVQDASDSEHIPAHIRRIADVSGAGDTVISVAALCLAQGIDKKTLASIANLAGGLVCEKVGVVPIEPEQLKAECLEIL